MKTIHQARVAKFMQLAGQELPTSPMIPDANTRLLRARLILEEAFETVRALGFQPMVERYKIDADTVELDPIPPDLIQIADGCADISVVTVGTLLACGIQDEPLLAAVDRSNLEKFAPGATRRADGKWLKPPDWKAPDIASVLKEQGWEG